MTRPTKLFTTALLILFTLGLMASPAGARQSAPRSPRDPGTALQVVKRCPAEAAVGQVITYTITITNTGTEPLVDFKAFDILLGDISALFPASLAPGETVVIEVQRQVRASDPNPLHNEVDVIAQGQTTGTFFRDAADCHTIIVHPGLDVKKRCPAQASVGDVVTYTIILTNTGTETLTNFQAFDILLKNITASMPASLAPGETVIVEVQRQIRPTDPSPLHNEVDVIAQGVVSGIKVRDAADCHTFIV